MVICDQYISRIAFDPLEDNSVLIIDSSSHEHLESELQYFELKVGFEPTTCGLRNRGDPSFVVNLKWIGHFSGVGGIQRRIWIPIWIPSGSTYHHGWKKDTLGQLAYSD
jgi:hypothetical protein